MTIDSTRTLGDLAGVYTLHVHCSTDLCHHNAPVDVPALCKQLGENFLLRHLAGRMRCSACGGRKVLTIVSPLKTGPGG